jgi:hypothetical protein
MSAAKQCRDCKAMLPLSAFSKHGGHWDGLRARCKLCQSARARLAYRKPEVRAKALARLKAYAESGLQRDLELKRTYGIGLDDYNLMLGAQCGCCAICFRRLDACGNNRIKAFHVDHDHSLGVDAAGVRGLLCQRCNHGIGLFRESADLLRNAIDYLENHNKTADAVDREVTYRAE